MSAERTEPTWTVPKNAAWTRSVQYWMAVECECGCFAWAIHTVGGHPAEGASAVCTKCGRNGHVPLDFLPALPEPHP